MFRRLLLWCIIAWLMPLTACVEVKTPEGGPPDQTPPKLIRSFPGEGALNFKGPKLRFTFDKKIAVEHVYKNLIVMPTLDKPNNKPPYSYAVKGKTLELKLHAPLKADTTYAFHLHNVVKDRHEGTKPKPLHASVTFSTGAFIDSITAKGQVKALLTNKPVENVNVYFYNAERDPKEWQKGKKDPGYDKEKCIPDYYTETDKDGYFTLNHIRLGRYYLRAVTGSVNNYQIDCEKEKYGFLKDPIDLNNSQEAIVVPLIESDVRDLKHIRVVPQKGFCEIIFNKAITKYQLLPLQTMLVKKERPLYSLISEKSPETIIVFNTLHCLAGEPFPIKIVVEDALHTLLEEEISLYFKEGTLDKKDLFCSVAPRLLPSILPAFTESITFNKPIQTFDRTLVYFECKDQYKIPLKEEELVWNTDKSKLTIKKNFSEEEMLKCIVPTKETDNKSKIASRIVTLQLEAGSCIAFDHTKNKKISLEYPFRQAEETGTIAGSVTTAFPHFIIELVHSESGQVLDSIRDKKEYKFTLVPPGVYNVRVRVLNAGETEWSPGDIRKNIEPNPVTFYDSAITVIEKWDLQGIDLKC
ncbi:Ig-like domain-containing domain [Candidatus Cardinium hertigii]|uniref:SbsA Ig-like domain-containing protein n=1 Tax=Candidatus Cardinium hertigii TaxID=247481 RepID=A0A2Z3L868_9BACT|nr:Ig-like domain-containing protein [Candidatus Cardinium hertigii]AWN81818.1 hypothetical protein DK880_00496 [Candidatus Cardinium hertigii]